MGKIEEEQFISEVVDLIYEILYQKITIDELEKYDISIKSKVIEFLNGQTEYVFDHALRMKLIYDALKNKNNFDLLNYLNKSDYIYPFPYECKYNKKSHKAALGYITKSEAIYCDVPFGSNHAEVVTEMHRLVDPNYEDLSFYHFLHEDDKDWHNKVMKEDEAIIIHFMPNEFGAAIYIPTDINDFQYQELLKINNMLLQKEIVAETNINDGLTLSEYLEELEKSMNSVNSHIRK